jgi:hypothetical protein
MKKTISLIVIGFLIISGFGAVANSKNSKEKEFNLIELHEVYTFSSPAIIDHGRYISLESNEVQSVLMDPGKPVLPRITKIYTLPFGSEIKSIDIEFFGKTELSISKEIRPAPQPIIEGMCSKNSNIEIKDLKIYSSCNLYPENVFTYRTCTGLNGTNHVVFLIIQFYPIRYSPGNNVVYFSDSAQMEITYKEPKTPIIFPNDFDLVIISPSKFETAIQPLVDHKNSMGMKTYFKTNEAIYSEFTNGRDDQENIKLFIKDAIETEGINFVLLVGGHKGQRRSWHLPVRNTNNFVGGDFEHGVDSDLYYADIYKNNGTAFEDWDSNGNGIFAEFRVGSKDILDGAPDVYVGRLPCRCVKDVKTMVKKIIDYEKEKAADSWFKDMLCIGGDTYPDKGPVDAYEAELDTNVSASYMTGFNIKRLWASLGTLTGQVDVEQAISNGCGFIHMAGHANPSILVTFPPGDENKEQKIIILRMYNIYNLLKFNPKLKNDGKLPIIVIGGCHNSQFNVSAMNILHGFFKEGFNYFNSTFYWMEWIPKCFSWWLTVKSKGGAIATIGNSGLGMGIPGFDYPNGLDGWLLPRFFFNYGQLGKEHVGEAHSAAITDYVKEFDINLDDADRQMVEQWVLIGDPSLLMGGYE